MRRHVALASAGIVCALLASATIALAALPVKGVTYAGFTARSKSEVRLSVARSGRTVRVYVSTPPIYCNAGIIIVPQSTSPATIGAGGSFDGEIVYHGGGVHTRVHFNGRFLDGGKRAEGSVRSQFANRRCNGVTRFTAKPSGLIRI